MNIKDMPKIAQCYSNKALNARSRKLEFSMSMVSFANIKMQTHCAYSGLPFTSNDQLSLERIDNNVGYVDGNVIPVIRSLNELRSDKSTEAIQKEIDDLYAAIAGLPDVKIHIQEKINTVQAELLAFQASPETTTKMAVKHIVPAKHASKYTHVINEIQAIERKIKMRHSMIAQAKATLLKGNLSKKQKAQQNTMLEAHQKALPKDEANLKKCTQKVKCFLGNFKQVKREVTVRKDALRELQLNSQLANLRNQSRNLAPKEQALTNQMGQLIHILHGIRKFENLNDIEKTKIKLGLPLETSTLKMLKHKLAYNCLVNQI